VEGEPKNFQILQRSLPAENLPELELPNKLLKKKKTRNKEAPKWVLKGLKVNPQKGLNGPHI